MRTFNPAIGKDAPLPPRTGDAYRERTAFYNSPTWRSFSAAFLAEHTLCEFCGRAAHVVDHITPRLDDTSRAFDKSNCRALCRECHSEHGKKRHRGV